MKRSSPHSPAHLSPEALQTIISCDWPGNVRQLENVPERAAVLCDEGIIKPSDLPREIQGKGPTDDFKINDIGGIPLSVPGRREHQLKRRKQQIVKSGIGDAFLLSWYQIPITP